MIHIARFLLIGTAYALLPVYGLWIFAGRLADKIERENTASDVETKP